MAKVVITFQTNNDSLIEYVVRCGIEGTMVVSKSFADMEYMISNPEVRVFEPDTGDGDELFNC